MLKSCIVDGHGNGEKLHVGDEGEISAVLHSHPPTNDPAQVLPFRQYFTDTGIATGDNDMIVNGSTSAPLDFCITASKDYDIYIKTLSVQISDVGGELDLFGNLTALTNGVMWIWDTQTNSEYCLHDGIKDNLEFIRLGLGQPAFDKTFKVDIKGKGSDDTYLPVIDLTTTFGVMWGLRLRQGTLDKLTFRVQDDLTGLSVFNVIGYGIRHAL